MIEYLIFPPASPLLLLAGGLLLSLWQPMAGLIGLGAGTALLYLTSIPLISVALLKRLEGGFHALKTVPADPQVIVVLGGGRYFNAKEYGHDTVSHFTLERVRYAAYLHRRSGLPLLTVGGRRGRESLSEAQVMKQVLEEDFQSPVKWLEANSGTTYQNAQGVAALLRAHGINHVLLVTHAFHMRRAHGVFRRAGLIITPAPTAFGTRTPVSAGLYKWLPQPRGVLITAIVLHEYLGLLWYWLRYR